MWRLYYLGAMTVLLLIGVGINLEGHGKFHTRNGWNSIMSAALWAPILGWACNWVVSAYLNGE